MSTLPPRAYKLDCSFRAAVFQARWAVGAIVAGRRDSGGWFAYGDGGIAGNGAVARAAIPEVSPGVEPGPMVYPGGQPEVVAGVRRREYRQRL